MLTFVALTPYLVRRIGVEAFGIFTLSQAISGYLSLLNLGFADALTRNVASIQDNDAARLRLIYWAGALLFGTAGLIGCGLLLVLAPPLGERWLSISTGLRAEAVLVLQLTAPMFLLQMLTEFYRGIATGLQRFDIPNVSRTIRALLSAVSIVVAIEYGLGLVGAALGSLVGISLGFIQNAIWMRTIGTHESPKQRLSLKSITDQLAILWGFARHIFVSRISSMASGRFLTIILGILDSASSVGAFDVVSRLFEAISTISGRILGVLYPAIAVLDRDNGRDAVRSLVNRAFSISLFVLVPLVCLVANLGDIIIGTWLSPEMAKITSGVMLPIGLSVLLSAMTNAHTFALMGIGSPAIIGRYSIYQAAFTVAISLPLIYFYGLAGAGVAVMLVGLWSIKFVDVASKELFDSGMRLEFGRAIAVHMLLGSIVLILGHVAQNLELGIRVVSVIFLFCIQVLISIAAGAIRIGDLRSLVRSK